MKVFENATRIAKELFGNSQQSEKVFGDSDSSSWMSDLKEMRKMILATINGNFKMSGKSMLIIIGGLIYVISPLDFLPAFIPIIGVLDDIAILAWVYKKLKGELNRYKSTTGFQDAEVVS